MNISPNTKIATCVYLLRNDDSEVLLPKQVAKIIGRKGYGGKVEIGQTIRSNATEEIGQESGKVKKFRIRPDEKGGITVKEEDLEPIALIDFYNGEDIPIGEPSFRCHFFLCRKFKGSPIETKEMIDPRWYSRANLPLEELVKHDEEFVPLILNRVPLKGHIRRTADWSRVIENTLAPCTLESLDF